MLARTIRPLIAVLLLGVAFAPAAAASQVNGTTINDHGTQNVSNATSVAMTMGNGYFSPSTLQGRPGQTLTIDLTNGSSVSHTFTIASQNVDTTVAPGQKASVTVKFPTSGSTVFICRFHTSMGMNGALQAVAASSPTPTATATRSSSTGTTGTTTTGGSTTTRGSTTTSGSTTSGATGQVAPVPAGGAATGAGGASGSDLPMVTGLVVAGVLVLLGAAVLRRRPGRV